ncbi:DNA-3-methyladenine glycosylase II [Paracandidimonas soli]|uniref:DNA-3-methyladenine glycosylase II n=2 Tax=Paracandidimonas soli TaxID=1917182 RepID=A0A4R3UU81_9BURK|nr:DNA-3-methyladenine glycosylase II [Paracandidimonas soli]
MAAQLMDSVIVSSGRPDFWEEACTHLMGRDRILKRLIPRHAAECLVLSEAPFVTLARLLIGQQVSLKTAETTWTAFTEACGRNPTPKSVLKYTDAQLHQSGLPKRKALYLLDLAQHFSERKVRPSRWDEMDDEAVIAQLCAIRGIGRWTAEMFLIFSLGRPDVLPLDDPGLLKAISMHYFSGEPVSRFEAREVAQAWAPWRTVASWYLWRSLDPATVQYGTT